MKKRATDSGNEAGKLQGLWIGDESKIEEKTNKNCSVL
jgi:hypothetical protein